VCGGLVRLRRREEMVSQDDMGRGDREVEETKVRRTNGKGR
jgi:hypothetical protein